MTGILLTTEEMLAEAEGRKEKADHVNFYDPLLWEDLHVRPPLPTNPPTFS